MSKSGKAIITLSVISVVLLVLIGLLIGKVSKTSKELSISKANEKAFIAENSSLKEDNRMFQFTIEQLEYFNDSILQKMDSVRKELAIKNRDLKQMQYLLSEAKKTDTIFVSDTIFRDRSLNMDTIIGDKWHTLGLKLKYPNIIVAEPSFISEKYVAISYKKETVNPPKKCAFLRWFQKKHKVITVEVVEESPYIKNKQQKFIEIIK